MAIIDKFMEEFSLSAGGIVGILLLVVAVGGFFWLHRSLSDDVRETRMRDEGDE